MKAHPSAAIGLLLLAIAGCGDGGGGEDPEADPSGGASAGRAGSSGKAASAGKGSSAGSGGVPVAAGGAASGSAGTSSAGGTKAATGGSASGAGGTKAGAAGAESGTGGTKAGAGGTKPGAGGSTAGSGGTKAGSGGTKTGSGGNKAGSGGTQTGTGGNTAAGSGGTSAVGGGGASAAGTGGTAGGAGTKVPSLEVGEITGATDAELVMIADGVALANLTMASSCFEDAVLSASWTETEGLSQAQIYDKLCSGTVTVDVEMYLGSWYQNNVSKTVGYENEPGKVHMNRYFVDSAYMVADNLVHEAEGHSQGFSHYGVKSTSVPYGLNEAFEACSPVGP